jgi:hypothetical protein
MCEESLRCGATHKLKTRRTLYECQSNVLSLKLFEAISSVELLLQNIICARQNETLCGQFRKLTTKASWNTFYLTPLVKQALRNTLSVLCCVDVVDFVNRRIIYD